MFNRTNFPSGTVYIVSFMFVLSLIAPISLAQKDSDSVVVANHVIDGSVVHVSVMNPSNTSQTVYVCVDATVTSMNVRGCTPVSVFAGSTAETVVGFADVIDSVGAVGIIESGNPQ